eukprot:356645-Chlamydomonas_euryale.AAC.2
MASSGLSAASCRSAVQHCCSSRGWVGVLIQGRLKHSDRGRQRSCGTAPTAVAACVVQRTRSGTGPCGSGHGDACSPARASSPGRMSLTQNSSAAAARDACRGSDGGSARRRGGCGCCIRAVVNERPHVWRELRGDRGSQRRREHAKLRDQLGHAVVKVA